ncbi:hypothetical protein [Alkaliphilus crotonatoxidans]
MDVFSHGLWGGLFFGRRKKYYRFAFVFGLLPDLIPLLPYTVIGLISGWVNLRGGTLTVIPQWVYFLYNMSHSFVVAGTLLIIIRLIWGKELAFGFLAWPLHIAYDIPTHSADYFPTKFLYPLSDIHFNGVNWSHPLIMLINYFVLCTSYSALLYFHWKKSQKKINWKPLQ